MAALKFTLGPGDDRHPFTVRYQKDITDFDEMINWCEKTFTPERYDFTSNWVWFKNEDDRNWFILRWS